MRYIRNISDDQNKSGDTDNIFRFNLLQGSEIFNFGDYHISINIANSSGYILSMVPEKEFGNSVLKLDFNDQSLKSLTPDNYLLEVEVKFPDGTTATFPTKGGMPFTVNSNLKNTAGQLVPTVTFDEVLNAVDKKVNNYLATVVKGNKGDKGDKGDTGVVDTTADYTWTGTNTFTKLINGYTKTVIAPNTDLNANRIPGKYEVNNSNINVPTSMPNSAVLIVESNSSGSVIYQYILSRDILNPNLYTDVYMRLFIDFSWKPWTKIAQDRSVVHNTGTETIAGNKTFTGVETFTNGIKGYFEPKPDTNITDLNNVFGANNSGVYGIGNTTILNIPELTSGILSVFPLNSGTTVQFYTPNMGANKGILYIRSVYAGSWSSWIKSANDATVVHNTGTETVVGDKAFTGTTTLNNVVSSNVKNASITALGFTVNFAETALGVNVNVLGSGISLLADNTWHILGNVPANITKPKINMYSSMTFASPAGSTSTNTGFTLRVSFNTTGEIDYKIISLREGDKTNYTVPFDSFLSLSWIK